MSESPVSAGALRATASPPPTRVDVLVVGAGPAGSSLAAPLAAAGLTVAVAEALPDLRQAAFSSAALPLDAIQRFGLPTAVVASVWSDWQLLGPGAARRHWPSATPLGGVLDFGALRCWLADQAQLAGASLHLGWRAVAWQPAAGGALTQLRGDGGRTASVQSRWLIDASGQARALLGDPPSSGPGLVCGLGVEWLLKVPAHTWEPWRGRLSFLLGTDWIPQGYGWVFPMQPGLLKVGLCRLIDPDQHQPSLAGLLRQALIRLGLEGAEVCDRHGGLVRSTINRRESHGHGPLVALGDAVSTANLLGGEGIRHALASSDVLAPRLLAAHGGNRSALKGYPRALKRRLGWRWSLSGRLARRTWLGLVGPSADRRLTRLLDGLEATAKAQDLSALLFDYRFERYGPRALPYWLGWR